MRPQRLPVRAAQQMHNQRASVSPSSEYGVRIAVPVPFETHPGDIFFEKLLDDVWLEIVGKSLLSRITMTFIPTPNHFILNVRLHNLLLTSSSMAPLVLPTPTRHGQVCCRDKSTSHVMYPRAVLPCSVPETDSIVFFTASWLPP